MVLKARLARVEQRISEGRPSIVAGGRRLAHARHHLDDAGLSLDQWHTKWDAARWLFTADGESDAHAGIRGR
ncbi:hypothetical protein [Saccharopolyspora pogona]|uniref:hypothetical protein n=1 Tax=Saccharopolyspora pogona TaxID=333966 RepID=UPI0016869FFB|nr:hypothetical protein [Saccharopolyspora pogona]